jgi:hypothetical protein
MNIPTSANILVIVNFIILIGMVYLVYRLLKYFKRK